MYHDAILINVHAKDLRPVEWTMQRHNGTGCLYCGSAVMLPEGGAQAQCTDKDELLKCHGIYCIVSATSQSRLKG